MQILVADDESTLRLILSKALRKWGYDRVEAENGEEEAFSILNLENPPMIVILDWMMPRMDGIEVLRKIRAEDREIPFYIIMLTSKNEKADIIEGLNEGADDYLAKPFDLGELRARINSGKRIVELHKELVDSKKKLEYQLEHDVLTGLYSRRFIMEKLNREIARSQRTGSSFAVAICDIDHFKKINDSYGHQAGDIVMREFGKILEGNIREYDSVGRIGGEEFLMITPLKNEEDEISLFERVRSKVENGRIAVESGEISMTVSIGVTFYETGKDADEIIFEADKALYIAKNSGRNRVVFSKNQEENS